MSNVVQARDMLDNVIYQVAFLESALSSNQLSDALGRLVHEGLLSYVGTIEENLSKLSSFFEKMEV